MRAGIEVQRIFKRRKFGMETGAIEWLKQLQRLDTTNRYFLFAQEDEDRNSIGETANFSIEASSSFNYALWEQWKLPGQVKKFNLDFLHCTCNTAPLRLSLPLLLTLHDIIYLESLHFKGSAYQNFGNIYRRWVVPKIVNKSRLITTVSHFEKQNILSYFTDLDPEKIVVIHHAAPDMYHNHYPQNEMERVRKAYALPERFILFSANPAPRKNTRGVIEAYARYCEMGGEVVPLVMLNGEAAPVKEVLQEIGLEKWLEKFLLRGYARKKDMPMLYGNATLFLFPSLREGFGLPPLEAMRCATPVITSNVSSMPEVAGEAGITVDPTSPAAIAEAIYSVLNDETMRASYIQKGLEHATQFTWEKTALKMIKLYERMMTLI